MAFFSPRFYPISILSLILLPCGLSQYNVSDFNAYNPTSWSAANTVMVVNLGNKVNFPEWYLWDADPFPVVANYGYTRMGYHLQDWAMWASLAWVNNTIYSASALVTKTGLEMASHEIVSFLDLRKYASNIIFKTQLVPTKAFGVISEDNSFHLWTPLTEHTLMGERNTYGTGPPALFAAGVDPIAVTEVVDLAVVTEAAAVINLGYAEPWVRSSKANGTAPFSVNRIFHAEPAADAFIVLLTEVMAYRSFNGHFCWEYPSRYMRNHMRNQIDSYNAINTNKFDYFETQLAVPYAAAVVPIILFLINSVYDKANINADFHYGCFPGVFFFFGQYYQLRILNPGKMWWTSQMSDSGYIFYDSGYIFDDMVAGLQQDFFAVFWFDYFINAETSYSSFCNWYVPQKTPTTLPWTFDYMNNSMPEVMWSAYYSGQISSPQFYAYNNGICDGRKSADDFGDSSEGFYPSTDSFSRKSESAFLWATVMDSTFYMLWGHQKASEASPGAYTLSDWYTQLDSTPGFGLLTNFNPGDQNAMSTILRFKSAFRTQCTVFFAGSARTSNRNLATMKFQYNSSYEISSTSVVQPAFCMDTNPPEKKLECAVGRYFDFFWGSCFDCKPGYFASTTGLTACQECPAGEYSTQGLMQCIACDKGTFQSTTKSTQCDDCVAGKVSPLSGSQACTNCERGMFSSEAKQSLCLLCGSGYFQDSLGATDCKQCPSASSTLADSEKVSEADCFCMEGNYNVETWNPSTSKVNCTSCDAWPDIVSMCNGKELESKVQIRPGFMSRNFETIVYRCEGAGSACPYESSLGLQKCSIGGSGVACAMCKKEYKWDAIESKCVECDEASIAMIVIAAFVISCVIFRLRPKASTFVAKQLLDMIAFTNLSVPVQQLFDFVQFGMVLGMASIAWPQNIRTFLKRLGSIIDINMYSLECKMTGSQKDGYPFAYVVLLNMMPLMFITAVAILCLPNALSRKMKKLRMPSPVLGINLVFSLTSTLFMTIFNFAVSLCFQTYEHPYLVGNLEQQSSLTAFPYLLVGDSKVTGMRWFSFVCIFVWSICFAAVPLIIVWFSPSMRSRRDFRRCTVSLLMKYKDGTSWWISVELAAKVCVVLAVNIFHDPAWQYRWLGLTLVMQTCGVLVVWPYRLTKHNLGECLICLSKVLVLASGLTLFDPDLEKNDHLYFVVFFFAVLCLALEFMFCLIDFLKNKVEAYPNDVTQLDEVRRLLRLVLPRDYSSNERALTKLRELKYSFSKAPGNKGLVDVGMLSSNQGDMIAFFKSREKEDMGKLSLKVKQSEVLWTIALHYQTNVPGLCVACEEIKQLQTTLYNALKDSLPKDVDRQVDIEFVTSCLTKHKEKLNELQRLVETSGEQQTIAIDSDVV